MAKVNKAAEQAREDARNHGQFGEQGHKDPGTDIIPPTTTASLVSPFNGRRPHVWELKDVDHTDFPTDHLPPVPDWDTYEYVVHARKYAGALKDKIGGGYADTGGGCTAVVVNLANGDILMIASEGEIPSGTQVSMGIQNTEWAGYSQSNVFFEEPISVDQLAAEVKKLIGRHGTERNTWTLE